jgi:hypothetical protein
MTWWRGTGLLEGGCAPVRSEFRNNSSPSSPRQRQTIAPLRCPSRLPWRRLRFKICSLVHDLWYGFITWFLPSLLWSVVCYVWCVAR